MSRSNTRNKIFINPAFNLRSRSVKWTTFVIKNLIALYLWFFLLFQLNLVNFGQLYPMQIWFSMSRYQVKLIQIG